LLDDVETALISLRRRLLSGDGHGSAAPSPSAQTLPGKA
jgi:hypothetical protein